MIARLLSRIISFPERFGSYAQDKRAGRAVKTSPQPWFSQCSKGAEREKPQSDKINSKRALQEIPGISGERFEQSIPNRWRSDRWLKKNKCCWRKHDLNCSSQTSGDSENWISFFAVIPHGLKILWFQSFPMELKQSYQVLRWRKYWRKAKPKKTNKRRKMTKHWKTARRGKWKYTVDLFIEFETIGNHRAICQTAPEVSKLELHQSKARMEKCLQWQWNRKIGLSHLK